MTNKQRAQVVELLRCAADVAIADTYGLFGPSRMAAHNLRASSRVMDLATAVAKQVAPHGQKQKADTCATYVHVMLEAAQRVEERSWP